MDKLDGLDRVNDGILAMLQDIKQMVFGCGLLLAGIVVTMFAIMFSPLACLIAVPFIVSGCLRVWNGWQAHEVVEKGNPQSKAPKSEQPDL